MIKGSIGFSTNNSIWNRLIRWYSDSDWSHTFIVISDEDCDYDLLVEAQKYEVKIIPFSVYNEDKTILFKPVNIDDKDLEYGIHEVITRGCVSYGWFQILGFLIVCPLKAIGIKVRNPFRGGIICTELVYNYLEAMGIDMPFHDKNSITPEQMFRFVNESEHFEKIEDK